MTPDINTNVSISDSFKCPMACCIGKKRHHKRKSTEKKVHDVAREKIVHVRYDSETGKTVKE